MSYYEYMNDQISKYLDSEQIEFNNNVVLYPFGKQGMAVKEILNWRYGIKEAFICDDGLSKRNPNIKPLSYLSQIDTSKFYFIITADNLDYWDEIRINIRKYVDEKNILDLFPVKPLLSNEPRTASLETASREIYNRNVKGAVAEAGVYKGDFSVFINRFFYDRKLYLFDTFEGFTQKDIEIERKHGYTLRNAGFFGDTSVELVLSKMPFQDNIIVKKGYFPDTTVGIEEQFCFVSLDMDLYQPIKAGLEYFYPRMSTGGYIFVHDCMKGHPNYKGARAAFLEFTDKMGIGYVILPDNGTAVIVKGGLR